MEAALDRAAFFVCGAWGTRSPHERRRHAGPSGVGMTARCFRMSLRSSGLRFLLCMGLFFENLVRAVKEAQPLPACGRLPLPRSGGGVGRGPSESRYVRRLRNFRELASPSPPSPASGPFQKSKQNGIAGFETRTNRNRLQTLFSFQPILKVREREGCQAPCLRLPKHGLDSRTHAMRSSNSPTFACFSSDHT